MTDMIFVRMDSLDTGDPGWLCGSHRSLPTLDTETDPCVCAALHSASIRAEKDRSPIGTIWGKTSQTSVKLTARTNTERSHRPCAAGGHKGVDGPTAQCCWRPDAAGRRDTSAGFIGMPGLLKASYYHCMYFVQHRAKGVGRHDGPVSPMPAQVRRSKAMSRRPSRSWLTRPRPEGMERLSGRELEDLRPDAMTSSAHRIPETSCDQHRGNRSCPHGAMA